MSTNPLHGTRYSPPRVNPPVDDEDAPICTIRGCGEEFKVGRAELGYVTCLKHSDRDPLNVIPPLILQEVNKSNPSVTRRVDFIEEAYQDRKIRMPLRQTRSYVQLGSYSDTGSEDE